MTILCFLLAGPEEATNIKTIQATIVEHPYQGPGPTAFSCPEIISLKVSSTLASGGRNYYSAENMVHSDTTLAWVEGNHGDGTGESISFTVDALQNADNFTFFGGFLLLNGYTKDKDTWQKNGRVKRFEVLINGDHQFDIELRDTWQYQSFNIREQLQNKSLALEKGSIIKFKIAEIYPGSKYRDTCISLFMPECSN